MNAPGQTDAEREIARALAEFGLASEAADDAQRYGRLIQAKQALGHAMQITDALARAIAPAEPAQGPVMNFGAPGHPRAFAPGPR